MERRKSPGGRKGALCAERMSVSRVTGRAAAVFTCAEVTVLTCACVFQRAVYTENAAWPCFPRGKWSYSLGNRGSEDVAQLLKLRAEVRKELRGVRPARHAASSRMGAAISL